MPSMLTEIYDRDIWAFTWRARPRQLDMGRGKRQVIIGADDVSNSPAEVTLCRCLIPQNAFRGLRKCAGHATPKINLIAPSVLCIPCRVGCRFSHKQ